MKALIAGASLAFLVSPALVSAQMDQAPAGPTSAQRQQMMQMHQQMRAQMRQIHQAERSQALASLTPAHRQLLANIVGGLATSPNPDYEAAAAQLDRALGANEVQSLSRVRTNSRTQMQTLHQQMLAQMQSNMTAEQRAAMDSRRNAMGAPGGPRFAQGMQGAPGSKAPQSAGHYLLSLSMGHGPMGGPGMEGGPRGMMMHGGPGSAHP